MNVQWGCAASGLAQCWKPRYPGRGELAAILARGGAQICVAKTYAGSAISEEKMGLPRCKLWSFKLLHTPVFPTKFKGVWLGTELGLQSVNEIF